MEDLDCETAPISGPGYQQETVQCLGALKGSPMDRDGPRTNAQGTRGVSPNPSRKETTIYPSQRGWKDVSADVRLSYSGKEYATTIIKKLLRDEATRMIHYLGDSRNPAAWWRSFWPGVI